MKWRKYFELSKIRHKQNLTSPKYSIHVKFLHDIRRSKTVSIENGIEIKTTEKSFEFIYFHFNYNHATSRLAKRKFMNSNLEI